MKTINRICFVSLGLLLCSLPMGAQIEPTVEVSREYDVKLLSLDKPFIGTSVPDSLRSFHINMDYYTVDKPYGDLYDFSPHTTYLLAKRPEARVPVLFFRAGAGYPFYADAAFCIETPVKRGFSLDAYLSHHSCSPSFDSLGGVGETRFMKNEAAVRCRYGWKGGEADLDLTYSGDLFGYRDTLYTKSVSNRFGAKVNVRSVGYPSNVCYDITASYGYSCGNIDAGTLFKGAFSEQNVDFSALFGGLFDNNRFLLSVESRNLLSGYVAGLMSVAPYYRYLNNVFDIKAGIRLSSKYSHGDTLNHQNRISYIFPLLDVGLRVIPDVFWLEASFDGDNSLGSFTEMRSENPWISTGLHLDFSTPYTAKLEGRLLIADRLSLTAFASYSIIKNMRFSVVDDGLHLQDYIYADAKMASAGADAVWNSKGFSAKAYYRYNDCRRDDGDVPYLIPEKEWGGNVRYSYIGRIVANLYLDHRDYVAFDGGTLDPIWDLGCTVGYVFQSKFSLFFKAGNILGKRNEYLPWSVSQPRNFGIGAAYGF